MVPLTFSRRAILRMVPAFALQGAPIAFAGTESAVQQFRTIEFGIGGRLGVAALDTGSGRRLAYRGEELFAMCSTFKFLLAACILKRADAKAENLNRRISYSQKDLLEYAPVTRAHVQEGSLTVGELCAAAVEVSDNTAANLLLEQVGGPAGLTDFIRTLGNRVTRLDRTEPDLNSALPGDPRDTTSPIAMVESMEKLLTGEVLSAVSRKQLAAWMEKCSTGSKRLRAGIPADWRAGDKTGTGARGAMGDIGIFWPPARSPILVAAYVMEGDATAEQREQGIAAVGRIVSQTL